jgi:hypothetical protein
MNYRQRLFSETGLLGNLTITKPSIAEGNEGGPSGVPILSKAWCTKVQEDLHACLPLKKIVAFV